MWCMEFNKITIYHVYDSKLNVNKRFKLRKLSKNHRICTSEEGDVFIASSAGLYKFYRNGSYDLILTGYSRDVTLYKNTLYVVYHTKKDRVLIVKQENGFWLKKKRVKLNINILRIKVRGTEVYTYSYKEGQAVTT